LCNASRSHATELRRGGVTERRGRAILHGSREEPLERSALEQPLGRRSRRRSGRREVAMYDRIDAAFPRVARRPAESRCRRSRGDACPIRRQAPTFKRTENACADGRTTFWLPTNALTVALRGRRDRGAAGRWDSGAAIARGRRLRPRGAALRRRRRSRRLGLALSLVAGPDLRIESLLARGGQDRGWRTHPLAARPCQPLAQRMATAAAPALRGGRTAAAAALAGEAFSPGRRSAARWRGQRQPHGYRAEPSRQAQT
jgi:hypothetical protein